MMRKTSRVQPGEANGNELWPAGRELRGRGDRRVIVRRTEILFLCNVQ